MYTLTLTYNGKVMNHTVYTRAEADRAGVRYVPWRVAGPRAWALTDDGYVAQVLHVKVYDGPGGKVRILRTFAFWSVWFSGVATLTFVKSVLLRLVRSKERVHSILQVLSDKRHSPEKTAELESALRWWQYEYGAVKKVVQQLAGENRGKRPSQWV